MRFTSGASIAGALIFTLSLQGLPAAIAASVDYGALEQLVGEPVTTSVTGSPQRASEVPASMVIVTADDIRRSGARDIPGVLRHVTGVDVLQWGNDNADVSIRGYNQPASPRTLVLIDGRQVYADYYGMTPWAALPIELAAIRQIEIVKGPNNAVFGFNAVGGVINIVSFHPLHDEKRELTLMGGTQGLAQGSLVASHRFGESLGLRVMVGGNGNDDFATPQRPVDLGSRRGNERAQVNLSGFMRLSDTTELGVEVTRSQAEAADVLLSYRALNQQHYTRSGQVTLSSDSRLGLLQARVYGNWIDSAIRDTPEFRFRNRVFVAQAQDMFKIGTGHTLRLALEHRSNTVNTTPVEGGRVGYDVNSFSAMWQWALPLRVTLTNALRLDDLQLERSGYLPADFGLSNADWRDRSISELSFNSGLVWRAGDTDTLRVTVARGAQLPSLFMLGSGLLQFGPAQYYGGVPSLRPAIDRHHALAWTRLVPGLGGEFTVGIFANRSHDLLANAGGPPVSAVLLATPSNVGNSKSRGVEASMRGQLSAWRWSAGYTYLRIKDRFPPGVSIATTLMDYENTTPQSVLDLGLGWTSASWEVDGYLRHQSRNAGIVVTPVSAADLGPSLVPIEAYWSLDARVGFQVSQRVTLAVSGQNLLHARQRQTGAAAVERRILGSVTASF